MEEEIPQILKWEVETIFNMLWHAKSIHGVVWSATCRKFEKKIEGVDPGNKDVHPTVLVHVNGEQYHII